MAAKSFPLNIDSQEEGEGQVAVRVQTIKNLEEDAADHYLLSSVPESSTTTESRRVSEERSFTVFLIHFLRITLALAILGSFDHQWLHCFLPNHQADAFSCRNDCATDSSNSTCWLANPCFAGGAAVFSLCIPLVNSTTSCVALENPHWNSIFYETCPETEGSYCELTASSVCTCRNWIIFSLIAVGLHVIDIVFQIIVIWKRHYDPNYLQYHWTLTSDFRMLFNPWNCWVGWYDTFCLLVISFLQLIAIFSRGCSGVTLQTYVELLKFSLLLILKEALKINTFVFMTHLKKSRYRLTLETIKQLVLSLLRVDRLMRYLFVILCQAAILPFSVLFIFPFYFGWYDAQVNIDLYRKKDPLAGASAAEGGGEEEDLGQQGQKEAKVMG